MRTRLWILVTWDKDRPGVPDSPYRPVVSRYTDSSDAAIAYRAFRDVNEHAYLYVTDESGHMRLILETEDLPSLPG